MLNEAEPPKPEPNRSTAKWLGEKIAEAAIAVIVSALVLLVLSAAGITLPTG